MKYLVLLLALFSTVLCDRLSHHVSTAAATGKDCREQSGVDPEILNNARAGTFTDDEKYKEYLFCYQKQMGLLNEEGDIQKDAFKQIISSFSKDKVKYMMETCATKKGSTPQDTAFLFFVCYNRIVHNRN